MAKEKILIIEDDPAVAKLIQINLEFENYQPVIAVDGEAGLIKAGSEKPDLILLDILLPKMNGLELLKHLKKSPETAAIPVMMLTALGQEDDLKTGYDLGVVDYISKPFTINRLLSAVESYVRNPDLVKDEALASPDSVTKVAIIGLGETGMYSIHVLQGDPHFKILGVSDLNNNVEGIQLAKKLNIPIYDDIAFFTRQVKADCVLVSDSEHYHAIHEKILNINSQEIVGPMSLSLFLHVIKHLEQKEKVTRAVLREYKQVIE